MTTYLIFRRGSDPDQWEKIAAYTASSPKHALRQLHDTHPISQGEYAAVPARNWTELTPELVTETRLVFR